MRIWTFVACLLVGCGPKVPSSPAAVKTANEAFRNPDERRGLVITPNQGRKTPNRPEELNSGAISAEAFAAVKAAFQKLGARVERDYTTPGGRTVRIFLPLQMAMELSESQAQTLAAATRDRLGPDAVVYIKGPGGNTLGKASYFD